MTCAPRAVSGQQWGNGYADFDHDGERWDLMLESAAEACDSTAPDPKRKPKRRRSGRPHKVQLRLLSELDARTAAYRRASGLIASIEADLGGSDRLSVAERQLVQRAGVTGALLEDMEARWLSGEKIDPTEYCTIANAQRRSFEAVGIKRVARDVTPDLKTYLAGKAVKAGP